MSALYEILMRPVEVPVGMLLGLWVGLLLLMGLAWVLSMWLRSVMIDGERLAVHAHRVVVRYPRSGGGS